MANYTVKGGETLSGIAKAQGTTVAEIIKANPTYSGFIKDPTGGTIYAETSLNLPGATPKYSTIAEAPKLYSTLAEAPPPKYSTLAEAPKPTPTATDLTGGITIPDLGTLPPADTKGVDTALTNAKSTSELLAQQLAKQEEERKKLEEALTAKGATGATTWEKILSFAGQKPEAKAVTELATQQKKYQVPELLGQVQAQNIKVATIQGDITKLEVQYLNDVEREKARQVAMPVIDVAVNERTRKYQSERAYKVAEMSAEAALMQAYQGNFNAARSLVSDAVNAYTYDIQQQRSDFDTIFSVYGDWINSLDTRDRQLLEDARADLKTQEANTREDYLSKLDLMTDAAGKGVNLGVSISDAKKMSLEEMTNLYQTKVSVGVKAKVGEFTDQEKRKLEQAGLKGATRQEQLNYLYGKQTLSSTQLTKLAVAGVPNNVALNIQQNLNAGNSIADIKKGLTKQLGNFDLANQYVDSYLNTMQTMSSVDELINLLQGAGL